MGVGAGCGVLGGWAGVSGWVAVAAAGGPLLAGVLTGVLGEVGAAGLAVLALYMGVRCLNWLGRVVAAAAAGVADSSGCRPSWRASRPDDPPALAGGGAMEGDRREARHHVTDQ